MGGRGKWGAFGFPAFGRADPEPRHMRPGLPNAAPMRKCRRIALTLNQGLSKDCPCHGFSSRNIAAPNEEMKVAGVRVLDGGLHTASQPGSPSPQPDGERRNAHGPCLKIPEQMDGLRVLGHRQPRSGAGLARQGRYRVSGARPIIDATQAAFRAFAAKRKAPACARALPISKAVTIRDRWSRRSCCPLRGSHRPFSRPCVCRAGRGSA